MALDWKIANDVPRLTAGEVRVYRYRLDRVSEEFARFLSDLHADEQERASRFIFSGDRERYVACRGVLRKILEQLVAIPAREIEFRTGVFGKPQLFPQTHHAEIHFNLSHSHGFAVYAFSCSGEVGIDVEKVRADGDLVRSVSQFFSPSERATIDACAQARQLELFYRCWVMKEAYSKARGEGLQIPLDGFDLPAGWADLRVQEPVSLGNCSVTYFELDPGYVAALASEEPWREISQFEWRA